MEDTPDRYTFGMGLTGAALYGQHRGDREGVCNVGRDMAELTIPSAFPHETYKAGDYLPGNNHSLGAFLVNSLASNLAFMAFPPNLPILKFTPKEYEIQDEVAQDPELWAAMLVAMSRLEITHRTGLQATPLQDTYTDSVKALLIVGNVLWRHVDFEAPSFHLPYQYVVLRDRAFRPRTVVFEEEVYLYSLDDDVKAFITASAPQDTWLNVPDHERKCTIYCNQKVRFENGEPVWDYWEECNGFAIPDTEVTTDYWTPPMWPAALIPVFGSNWARGYCEEYRGDLFSLEANESSMNDGAALAALSITFVKPGSATSIRQVREANNLAVLPGVADDVTVLRSDKGGDLNIVENRIDRISRRLGSAFLVQQSIQRSGERVTAEEIIRMGRDLDRAMGGLYTKIAQGSQKVAILRAVALHEEENPKLTKLPTGVVSVNVVTGTDAMGQSAELTALQEWAADGKMAYQQTFEAETNGREYLFRTAASRGIKPEGLIKSAEQKQAETEQAQQQGVMQTLMDKGTGPAVKGMADAMAQQGTNPMEIMQDGQQ